MPYLLCFLYNIYNVITIYNTSYRLKLRSGKVTRKHNFCSHSSYLKVFTNFRAFVFVQWLVDFKSLERAFQFDYLVLRFGYSFLEVRHTLLCVLEPVLVRLAQQFYVIICRTYQQSANASQITTSWQLLLVKELPPRCTLCPVVCEFLTKIKLYARQLSIFPFSQTRFRVSTFRQWLNLFKMFLPYVKIWIHITLL